MIYNIKISSTDAAQKLNQIATQFPYDIWVHGKSGMADAKSILGLMLLTLEQDLKLVVDDNIDTKALEKDITEFIID